MPALQNALWKQEREIYIGNSKLQETKTNHLTNFIMFFNQQTKVALLAGVVVGVVVGAAAVKTGSTSAFMGTRPDEAIKMDSLKWIDEENPKYKPAAMKPRDNFVELQPSSIWFGPARCRQFHLGPRYTKCLLRDQQVGPTKLPYPDKSR
jgi:hypothetical protein